MAEEEDTLFKPDKIGHLLGDKWFRVPVHQRSYKWDHEEHVRRLFLDVQDALDDDEADGYFLGMVVLKKGKNPGDRLEVIDGQQRLATLCIFLAAVRDYFRRIGDGSRADDIQRDYLAKRYTRSQLEEARLHLNTEDKGFFQRHVIEGVPVPPFKRGDGTPASNRRIAEAIAEARAQVEKIAALGAPESAGDRLLDWVDFFFYKASVVAIYVPEDQNAYTLFETLNDRGLELTKADLIKNHLFGRAGNRLEDVRILWTEMTTVLEPAGGEEAIVDFIRHYWISRYAHVRTKKLYEVVKAKTHAARSAHLTAEALRDDARLYVALANPDGDVWAEYKDATRAHVRTLMHFGVSVIKPLALAAMRHLSVEEGRTAFQLFVSWSIRFLVVGGHRSEAVEVAFCKAAVAITNGEITTGPQLSKEVSGVIPSDDVFQAAFSTLTVSKPPLARYYLRAIEDRLGGDKLAEWISQPDAEKVNLEHVLPLRPSKEWNINGDDADALHNRLGNLAILPKAVNTKIGNDSFAKKRPAFQNSSYRFTNWIGDRTEWGEREIDLRQTELAAEAPETWPLRFW